MLEIFEIFAAVMSVFGIYTLLDMLRFRLLYPRKVRRLIRAAVVVDDDTRISEAAEYAKYLRREGKISSERLIILTNGDIIINGSEISRFGEILDYKKIKEADNDRKYESGCKEP